MAALYANAAGALLRMERTPGELGGTPPGSADELDFDPSTNPGLAADIIANWTLYTLLGTTLAKSGVAVAINAPGQDYQDSQQFAAILAALGAGSATNAQVQQVCRFMLRHGRQAGIW